MCDGGSMRATMSRASVWVVLGLGVGEGVGMNVGVGVSVRDDKAGTREGVVGVWEREHGRGGEDGQ